MINLIHFIGIYLTPTNVGMVGVILVLVSYCLLNINKLSSKSMTYLLLNLFGSVLIMFSLWFNWNLPSFLIEVAWIIISMIGILRVYYAYKKYKTGKVYLIRENE